MSNCHAEPSKDVKQSVGKPYVGEITWISDTVIELTIRSLQEKTRSTGADVAACCKQSLA